MSSAVSLQQRAKDVVIHPSSSLLTRRLKKLPGESVEAFVRTVPCLKLKVVHRAGTVRNVARLEAGAWADGWSAGTGREAHVLSVSTWGGSALFVTDDPEGFVKTMSDMIQVATIQES
jgi:hypothetical protein